MSLDSLKALWRFRWRGRRPSQVDLEEVIEEEVAIGNADMIMTTMVHRQDAITRGIIATGGMTTGLEDGTTTMTVGTTTEGTITTEEIIGHGEEEEGMTTIEEEGI